MAEWEQEGEARRRFAIEPGQQGGGDRRARARRSRDEREHLREADEQGVASIDVVHLRRRLPTCSAIQSSTAQTSMFVPMTKRFWSAFLR